MSRIISIEEVKKHNNQKSVWMIIHNDVYDVSSFLDEHPGGEDSLLESAGKEATQSFEDVGHSEDARELMKKYKIGTLPESERDSVPTQSVPTTWSPRPTPKSDQRVTIDPKPSDHVNSVVVPRQSGSNLKWYILALLGAIALGVIIKKKMQA